MNTGNQFGLNIKSLIERIKRCEHGSNGQKTAHKALKQRIDETVKELYTSQRCPVCGHVDRGNRSGTVFRCQSCGHTDNADVIGGRNILERFLTGSYGACYRPYMTM